MGAYRTSTVLDLAAGGQHGGTLPCHHTSSSSPYIRRHHFCCTFSFLLSYHYIIILLFITIVAGKTLETEYIFDEPFQRAQELSTIQHNIPTTAITAATRESSSPRWPHVMNTIALVRGVARYTIQPLITTHHTLSLRQCAGRQHIRLSPLLP